MSHQWPGNVRELANVVEHAAILCESLPIDTEDLPRHFGRRQLRKEIRDSGPMTSARAGNDRDRASRSNETTATSRPPRKSLGVSLKTLYNKLNAAEDRKQAS